MPPSVTTAALVLQFVLLLVGVGFVWRLALSPKARSQPALLPAWEVSLSDFFLFVWLVILGGLAGEYCVALYLKYHPLDQPHQLILGTAGFHLGMLVGIAGYQGAFARVRPRLSLLTPGAVKSGLATYLVAVPVLTAVSLVWQGLLQLCHVTAKPQESVELLRHIESPPLRFTLLFVAILVAPVSEELVFRAGIFRYLRTRFPRWAALLLPALLFASLHLDLGSFVPLVALALVFSFAYERTGQIGTTMVAHALFNLNAALLVLAGVDS